MENKEEKVKNYLSELFPDLNIKFIPLGDEGEFVKFLLKDKKEDIIKFRLYFDFIYFGKANTDEIVRCIDKEELEDAGNNKIVLIFGNRIETITPEKFKQRYYQK